MNLISISTDRKIFDRQSVVARRMLEYGALVDQLHVIVFNRSADAQKPTRLGQNVWVYPTNSHSRFFYIRDARRIGSEIIKSNAFSPANTIVSTQDPFETGLVGTYLKKRFGLKLQVQIHTDFMSPYFARHSFLNRLRGWIAWRVLPRASQIRAVSERIKTSLSQLCQQKTAVVPIYTDREPLELPPAFDLHKKYPQFSVIMTMVSRLAPEKNIGFALRVFKEILKKFPQAGLVVVGDGPEKERLEKLAATLEISQSVAFEPWTENVVPYYKTADIFLSTSLYEGYGLSLVEAGLARAAVVTSDVGVAGDLLVDNKSARVCPVGNEKCFITAVEALLASAVTRHALGEGARQFLVNGRVSKEQYLQSYKKLLEATLNEK